MMPTIINKQVPVPPPAYHRVQARLGPALHIDALKRGELAADQPVAYLVVLIISRHARLVAKLACVGPGLWVALEQTRTVPQNEGIYWFLRTNQFTNAVKP